MDRNPQVKERKESWKLSEGLLHPAFLPCMGGQAQNIADRSSSGARFSFYSCGSLFIYIVHFYLTVLSKLTIQSLRGDGQSYTVFFGV